MKELDKNELKSINAGHPAIALFGVGVMVSIYMYDNREKAIQGVKDAIKSFF